MSTTLVAPTRGTARKGEYPTPQYHLAELAGRWADLNFEEKWIAYLDDESTFQSLEECAQGPQFCVTCDGECFADEYLTTCSECGNSFAGAWHPEDD